MYYAVKSNFNKSISSGIRIGLADVTVIVSLHNIALLGGEENSQGRYAHTGYCESHWGDETWSQR